MTVELENHKGLMILKGTDICLGDLMDFGERGVFEPTLGRVDVTPEQAAEHNKIFDEAKVKGLDNCQIGQYGLFYLKEDPQKGVVAVTTWIGTVVSEDVDETPRTVLFRRNGMTFRGYKRKDEQCCEFKRIA